MAELKKTRKQREKQRAIQLAVINKLKTLQKRREMLKACVRKWCQRACESAHWRARKRRREELYARECVVHEKPVYVRGKRAVARGL